MSMSVDTKEGARQARESVRGCGTQDRTTRRKKMAASTYVTNLRYSGCLQYCKYSMYRRKLGFSKYLFWARSGRKKRGGDGRMKRSAKAQMEAF